MFCFSTAKALRFAGSVVDMDWLVWWLLLLWGEARPPQHCLESVQILDFFWTSFSWFWTKYKYLLRKSPYLLRKSQYSVQIQEKLCIWTFFTLCKENELQRQKLWLLSTVCIGFVIVTLLIDFCFIFFFFTWALVSTPVFHFSFSVSLAKSFLDCDPTHRWYISKFD